MDFSVSYELLLFIALGFFAQLVDGALGMAYGVIATTALLSLGTAPALASASVHAAEVVTTGLAGASHAWHRNIDWALFRRLAPAGVAGGIVGAYVLVGLPETWLKV
ncbi:MAG TPA: sulfite exporter TauE/SafE family protein, partial [Pseudorhodoplanes sp.]|nr:sulfite exporter TauE/SafE family protein [Pseudorhodoplanes sp.]